MTEQEVKLVVGGLLHDVGKVIYRTGDGRKHSISGCDFLKDEAGLEDKMILDSVRYHHSDALKSAQIDRDSYAYITCVADNIASAADRRKKEAEDYGFEMSAPLEPVFNILNGNQKKMYYSPMMLEEKINYPKSEKQPFDESFYAKVKKTILENIRSRRWNGRYINSLLEVLEATLSFVPSSTAKGELADISLFDHVKLTAAVNSCIYQYLEEQGEHDYRSRLFENAKSFYEEKAFLLYSIDLSGIQSFIYTIHTKDALKMLRSRSFYLEIMMEHIIDSILEMLDLSRANLIYSGGGHCYLLLPNTEKVKEKIEEYDGKLNTWLRGKYDIALYAATGYVETSADILKNEPQGSYTEMYRALSNVLGAKKVHRYSAADIRELNSREPKVYDRECEVCKRLGEVNEEGMCDTCSRLKKASAAILYQPFFTITKEDKEDALPLPGDCYMVAEKEEKLRQRMQEQNVNFVRVYSKNKFYAGMNIATKIWVGDYTKGQSFEELATHSKGIPRIGVLRADVDSLGQSFVGGFTGNYCTLSRTATLSRQLSLFFKYYINHILDEKDRNATIVYSGGDDMFIVGAWNEVIELAQEIRNAFVKYSEGSLTFSAGIGIYNSSYPISRIAQEVGYMENSSKQSDGKDAVTILPDRIWDKENKSWEIDDGTYKWKQFETKVIGEKYRALEEFFENSEERGKAFLYHLLELLRERKDTINFARYVYILARMEPGEKASASQKDLYREFSGRMYEWMKEDEACRQLKTAMNLYVYQTRESEGVEK